MVNQCYLQKKHQSKAVPSVALGSSMAIFSVKVKHDKGPALHSTWTDSFSVFKGK